MNKKTIALIAHDARKEDLIAWARKNEAKLEKFDLVGTGTTAGLITQATSLEVKGFMSGPLGGDMQIGSKIAEGGIDMLIFIWDPLQSHPHDPDVKALLRIAVLYDIPTATNIATADFLLSSPLMEEPYRPVVFDYQKRMQKG
jgi:methylglyoxal synthase